MGTYGGTLGRGTKALPRIQAQVGHGALARSLSGESLCYFLCPSPCLHLPFRGLPALPEGIQPP